MAAFDDLPPLRPHAPFLLALLLVVFWVYMKVKLVRIRLAARDAGEAPPKVPAWQLRLARSERTNGVLLASAIVLAAALALFGVFE